MLHQLKRKRTKLALLYSLLVILKLITPIQEEEETSQKKPCYNMIYAYYAVMGGFTVDTSHLHNVLPWATITTHGIIFLATHGHFLQITEDSIKDKSKADILAKGLVCVQVLWVVGQAIERKVAGYPITLLEVHTIVHIICALVLYALWIQKPQDVHDPTLISSGDFQDALAFMVLCSKFYSHHELFTCTYEIPRAENGDITFEKHIGWTWPFEDDEYLCWYGNIDQIRTLVDPVTEYGPSAHAWSRRVELPAEQQQPAHVMTYYKSNQQDSEGTTREYTACNTVVTYAPAGDPPPEAALTMYSGQALDSGLGVPFPCQYACSSTRVPTTPSATDRGFKVMLSQKQLTKLDRAGAFIKSKLPAPIWSEDLVPLEKVSRMIRGHYKRMLCFREANLKNTLWSITWMRPDVCTQCLCEQY